MRLNRHLNVAATLVVLLTLVPSPFPVAAAEPTLGDAITLPDGTVLPPMPAELIGPSIQAEMAEEHGGLEAADGGGLATQSVAVAAQPLVVQAEASQGPGGPLPNDLQREVLGFLPHWKLDATTRASLRLDLVSTIAYFGIPAGSDGHLTRSGAGWNGWTSAALTEIMNSAHARGVRVVPTVTLMSVNGNYTNLTALLTSPTNRSRLVGEIVGIIRDRRADGVNIDFEPVPASLRGQFTTFIREVKQGLLSGGVGSYLTVSTMAGAAAFSSGYDVTALTAAGAADALMVMAYDFHWSGSSRAGAVAPADSPFIYAAGDAIRDHLARVPASKVIWGIPYYGRAWNTTTAAQNSPVRSPASSVAFSYHWNDGGTPAGGKILAQRHGRRWDAAAQAPWFVFWDAGSNGYRQGYYDDPDSLRAKYNMVVGNGLAGIGIWHLGMDTGVPDLWNVIFDRFVRIQHRWAGADRYATAAQVSRGIFRPGVPVAYVASGSNFPDALAAGPIAAREGGPVLLTRPNAIPSATILELQRLRPRTIVVVGGPSAVNDGVLNALRSYATLGAVHRYSGADRYGTAASLSAAHFAPGAAVAYIATGRNFPDALAGGVAAAREGGPILLVDTNAIPPATATELARLRPQRIVVLGGSAVVSDGVLAALAPYAGGGGVTRIAGANRYATAAAVAQATTPGTVGKVLFIATGVAFPDGLAATPASALHGAPLLLVSRATLPGETAAELLRLNPQEVIVLGGTGAVSHSVVRAIAALWD